MTLNDYRVFLNSNENSLIKKIKNKNVLNLPVYSECLPFSTFQAEIRISIWQGPIDFFSLLCGKANTVLKTDRSYVSKKLKATWLTLHRLRLQCE